MRRACPFRRESSAQKNFLKPPAHSLSGAMAMPSWFESGRVLGRAKLRRTTNLPPTMPSTF
jgi:hypothetical protein